MSDDIEDKVWPAWKVGLWLFALRLRCLGLFHDFDECERGYPYNPDGMWYCRRCWTYERDEEFAMSGVWDRILFRIGYRVYHWWHSWAWRFER